MNNENNTPNLPDDPIPCEYVLELLAWAYGKLIHFSFSKQEDALKLDEIYLLLRDRD